ncbi:4-hydroxybenzoyl-CoA thioesterase [Alkalidesulfovibrio alkalitolerans DSM 16529]|uniref:4-hydroxybenzoyl-CoA thioesterase n=1 Tax=Alkalidesulfovibrio alkalitolerans DSM 16529 TaxID=1121439 RepID=S7UP49_9BACT|nr:thioesterase family protein [Alkalidesulfovibrio alkalitolerans]EPR35749.1 4-hydroxybenzoyl-CoA thioesterase [Alkalidesulfovibrio alkalitolerans DSM 16529]
MTTRNDEFPVPDAWFHLHVSYGETDSAGVVYYGEYMHWFERARSQLIRDRGMSYAEIEKRGILLPVLKAEARYLRPARYDEQVAVRCAVSEWGRASVTFVYQVWGPPDLQTLLTTGTTVHASIGPDWKSVRIPDWLKALFID